MPIPVPTPARAVALARAATRSALDNARSAGAQLGEAVSDRRELAPRADDDGAGLALLPEARCLELLAGRAVGRLAYVARAGTPDIAPVNYRLDGRDVLVRSGPGPKLQAAERGDVVAFEVDGLDEQARTGWSVVVVGRARVVRPAELAGTALPEPWSAGPRRHVVRIAPTRITGRRLG